MEKIIKAFAYIFVVVILGSLMIGWNADNVRTEFTVGAGRYHKVSNIGGSGCMPAPRKVSYNVPYGGGDLNLETYTSDKKHAFGVNIGLYRNEDDYWQYDSTYLFLKPSFFYTSGTNMVMSNLYYKGTFFEERLGLKLGAAFQPFGPVFPLPSIGVRIGNLNKAYLFGGFLDSPLPFKKGVVNGGINYSFSSENSFYTGIGAGPSDSPSLICGYERAENIFSYEIGGYLAPGDRGAQWGLYSSIAIDD